MVLRHEARQRRANLFNRADGWVFIAPLIEDPEVRKLEDKLKAELAKLTS